MAKINNLSAKSLIFLITLYRYLISPLLGNRCRFYPSCSAYALEALKNKGFFAGLKLVIYRLSKCHPWHPGGYDPIPDSEKR